MTPIYSLSRMADDVLYDQTRQTDREAAAAYLQKIAERLAAGKQVLPTEGDGTRLQASDDVGIDLRATDGETVRVSIGLEWQPAGEAPESDTASEPPAKKQRASGTPDDGDAHKSTGWASAGASEGYALPRLDSLDDADDEFERAAYFLRKGKPEAALNRFTSAIEETPQHARRRYHVATVCWRLGRPNMAATHFEAARELAPEDPTIALEYASFRWSQGQVAQAREVYERVLEIAPDSADVHSALGRFRWETDGDIETAADHLQRALDIDEDHALAHLNYAVLLRHGKQHDRAESHFQTALDERGEDPIVQTEYGHFLWEQGDIEAAAKHYARAE